MLFEPANEGSAASMPVAPRERADSTRTALSMTAAIMPETVPQFTAPMASPAMPEATLEPKPAPEGDDSPKPQSVATPAQNLSTATVRGSIFQSAPPAHERDSMPMPAQDRMQPSTAAPTLQSPVDTDGDQPLGAAVAAYDGVPPAAPVPTIETSDDPSADIAADDVATAPAAEPQTTPAAEPVAPASFSWPAAAKEPEAPPAAVEVTPAPAEPPAPMVSMQPPAAPVRPAPVAAPSTTPAPEAPSRDRGTAGLSRSEAIARAARLSALRGNGATASSSAPARSTAPAPQQRPADLPRHPSDLYGYWTRVKNGRRFPSRSDFDVEQVAENWPNSMLLTCGGGQMNFSSILRLGANRRSRPGEDLNFTSMITEWILAIGGEAVRAGTPVQDTEVFPSPEGTFAYKIVALPLSDQQTRVDHVLCHLSRS
jgi:hypothetical protein